MKRIIYLLVTSLMIGISLATCTKDEFEEQPEMFQNYLDGVLLLPEDEYAKLPVAKNPDIDLKGLFATNLNTPPVRHQGIEGSCVAWGTTYCARSIMWRKNHLALIWSTSTNIFSPEYVYNQIKLSNSCASGSYVKRGLDLLMNQGACRWSIMPYTDLICSTLPNSAQKSDALKYKTTGYATVSKNVNSIKAQIAYGTPVIVAGPVDNNFYNLANGVILKARGTSMGNHCYCVVGYDDSKNAFKVQNSWGTNWGSSGFGWIDYGYISQWWTEAYIIIN